ncbi:hypothetical protein F5J12DRAFT_928595 [Pisolithus orientalis]|uniref:uncharacterized protein n=1 Tax=Pisolithus orientalis TaxID=936130 RepID=UPI002224A92D|nr:uncharacterized protein F5J12DRAFT_928595 [Pisolithus orientalis]KAI6000147.1 hypothetical protein F5J12DRAFT_928595 [Pisolithus orientalis]
MSESGSGAMVISSSALNRSQGESTPNSRGLCAGSGQLPISGLRVDDLTGWAAEDVCKAQQCEADNMLEYILSRASNSPDDPIDLENHALLNRCMEAVLPICNGQIPGEDIVNFPLLDIRKALEEYTTCKPEDGLYQPFVLASNTALAHLKKLDINGMRQGESQAVQMFFQRNDPNVIVQKHQGCDSKRKPDIVVLPFANVSEYFSGSRSTTWDEHVSGLIQNKIPVRSWRDVFGVFEFKRSRSKMKSPPEQYSVSKYEASKPKFLEIAKDRNEPEGREPREAPATKQVTPAESLPVRRSARPTTQESTQMASRKRTLVADSEPRSSKRLRTEESPGAHITIQSALYAAEMQSANIAMNHALNFIVVGDNIWIWYYDHQGLISVAGFNFVQDLSRFLVLLYALQRFNLEDWGRNTAFKPHLKGDHVESYTVEVEGKTLKLVDQWDPRYGLAGRGTGVMDVTCEALKQENPAETVDGMVAKIYWAEEKRIAEKDILDRVTEAGTRDKDVRGHVPILLLSKRFLDSTSAIRKALDLEHPEKGSRSLVLLVFKKLWPITDLEDNELVDAWRQCILCHYALWREGIYHRDVSHLNLMYYRVGGKVMGVLNDYDLSSLAFSPNPLGNERTGTIPFMAIDLLMEDGQNGKVKHRYRHDVESLIYVFIWISLQYKDGKPLNSGPLDSWAKVNARGCAKEKRDFLAAPRVPHNINSILVLTLAIFLRKRLSTRDGFKAEKDLAQLKLEQAKSPELKDAAEQEISKLDHELEEESDEKVYEEFLSKIPPVN